MLAAGAGLLVLVAAFVPPLWHMLRGPAQGQAGTAEGLPWQTRVEPDGAVQVFGLALGRATLADAERRFGDALQLAIVARLGEPPALEALVDPFQAGFVGGRLVLAFDAPADRLLQWRERASGSSPMEGGARRFTLRTEDRAAASRVPIGGFSFVPAVRLGEQDVRQRFGPPAAVLPQAEGQQVLLYPERGLAASVSPGSRGVLQYVVPAQFEARLRAPLQAATASAASSAASR